MDSSFYRAMAMGAGAPPKSLSVTYGELEAYYPDVHEATFSLPLHPDDVTGEPVTIGPIPIGTFHTGVGGGYGAQFPPPVGAQAMIIFLDQTHELPFCAVMTFNEVDTPPWPDGRTGGFKDAQGSSIATSQDAKTPGDGQASAKVFGASYASQATTSGHTVALDDELKRISTLSAGGLETVHDDLTTEIAHLAPNIGLGARISQMASSNAALNQSHLTAFESSLFTQRLNDLKALATAAIEAGTPGASAWIGLLATLTHVQIPNGSSIVKIAS
jgi:hypothetical protein